MKTAALTRRFAGSSDVAPRRATPFTPAPQPAARASANADSFDLDSKALIDAWARRAVFASGFGGGLGDVDPALVRPRPDRTRLQSDARAAASAGVAGVLTLWATAARKRAGAAWRNWLSVRRARATARELARLDDRQLRDIGLDRSEILSAAFERERALIDHSVRLRSRLG